MRKYGGFIEIYDRIKMEELPMEEVIKKMIQESKPMELKDTIDLMTSADWKDRFLAEYLQTRIRYLKLMRLYRLRMVDKLHFETPIPIESWQRQLEAMELYTKELEYQAEMHGIRLPMTVTYTDD